MYRYSQFAYFYGIELDLAGRKLREIERGSHNVPRSISRFELVDGLLPPSFASPRARVYCPSFFLPFHISHSLSSSADHSLSFSRRYAFALSFFCGESFLKILYVVSRAVKIKSRILTRQRKGAASK
jgi:hypothetical protein